MSTLFPAFLKLEGRPVLVVGGGPVAAGKLPGLLDAGARITVVAPEVRPEVEHPDVRVERRAFRSSDLDGVFLAIAAATPEVNREVSVAAEARRVFVNAVDDVASASVYLGGVLRRGGVTFAISTDGQAPALAGLLREALEAVIPDELETWVAEARRVRARQKAERLPMSERRPLLLQALNRLYADRAAAVPVRS
ncbi:MAG TPA: bifunctional precorrin-2 dehydrogenase/sirohydrochlorin ferrochelatase [Vicinamibacteria bacterium]|nr:bifunctional precorrin-2 dehydrogenase/sirohydrochlorin ferrochelatase [Vicinamibacteria bacterium]